MQRFKRLWEKEPSINRIFIQTSSSKHPCHFTLKQIGLNLTRFEKAGRPVGRLNDANRSKGIPSKSGADPPP
jgi:hypothetical protein